MEIPSPRCYCLLSLGCHFLVLACLCILLSEYSVCVRVYPSVHSLSPSLLPSVPLIPECVTNGRSRCSALLCSSPRDPSSVYMCVCVCVWACARIPLMGGLELWVGGCAGSHPPEGKGGKGSSMQEVPASRSLLSGFPWAQDPLYHFPPGLEEPHCLSLSPSPPFYLSALPSYPFFGRLCTFRSRWRGFASC